MQRNGAFCRACDTEAWALPSPAHGANAPQRRKVRHHSGGIGRMASTRTASPHALCQQTLFQLCDHQALHLLRA